MQQHQQQQRSVRMITKCLSVDHLKSLNPTMSTFETGQQLSVFRSDGTIEHDWVVVESLGREILVSRLEKDQLQLSSRAS